MHIKVRKKGTRRHQEAPKEFAKVSVNKTVKVKQAGTPLIYRVLGLLE